MTRRPRITARVVAGLEAIAAHAQADREVMGANAWGREHLDNVDSGLEFVRRIGQWYRGKHRGAGESPGGTNDA